MKRKILSLVTLIIFSLPCLSFGDNTLRIKRGLEAYESDLKIFYEGFVLSDKYSEKMKILDNILYIVDEMKKL